MRSAPSILSFEPKLGDVADPNRPDFALTATRGFRAKR
jgi:hypothetical protein